LLRLEGLTSRTSSCPWRSRTLGLRKQGEFIGKIIIYWSIESGDRELGKLWRSAISMQVNFYEGWATLEAVRDALEDARELLEKLRCLGERQDRCS